MSKMSYSPVKGSPNTFKYKLDGDVFYDNIPKLDMGGGVYGDLTIDKGGKNNIATVQYYADNDYQTSVGKNWKLPGNYTHKLNAIAYDTGKYPESNSQLVDDINPPVVAPVAPPVVADEKSRNDFNTKVEWFNSYAGANKPEIRDKVTYAYNEDGSEKGVYSPHVSFNQANYQALTDYENAQLADPNSPLSISNAASAVASATASKTAIDNRIEYAKTYPDSATKTDAQIAQILANTKQQVTPNKIATATATGQGLIDAAKTQSQFANNDASGNPTSWKASTGIANNDLSKGAAGETGISDYKIKNPTLNVSQVDDNNAFYAGNYDAVSGAIDANRYIGSTNAGLKTKIDELEGLKTAIIEDNLTQKNKDNINYKVDTNKIDAANIDLLNSAQDKIDLLYDPLLSKDNISKTQAGIDSLTGAARNDTVGSWNVDDGSDQLVSSRINKILENNNKYIDEARQRARAGMNARGLINSSIATQAGEQAAYSAALPVAQADAQAFSQAQSQNAQIQAALKSQALGLQSGAVTTDAAALNKAYLENLAQQASAAGLDSQQYLAALQGNQAAANRALEFNAQQNKDVIMQDTQNRATGLLQTAAAKNQELSKNTDRATAALMKNADMAMAQAQLDNTTNIQNAQNYTQTQLQDAQIAADLAKFNTAASNAANIQNAQNYTQTQLQDAQIAADLAKFNATASNEANMLLTQLQTGANKDKALWQNTQFSTDIATLNQRAKDGFVNQADFAKMYEQGGIDLAKASLLTAFEEIKNDNAFDRDAKIKKLVHEYTMESDKFKGGIELGKTVYTANMQLNEMILDTQVKKYNVDSQVVGGIFKELSTAYTALLGITAMSAEAKTAAQITMFQSAENAFTALGAIKLDLTSVTPQVKFETPKGLIDSAKNKK